jgi:hypothetical protein
MAILLGVIVRGLGRHSPWVDLETDAVVTSVRNCALASIVSGSLVSGTADPGIVFFIALAVISATRVRARRARDVTRPSPEQSSGTRRRQGSWDVAMQ